MIDKRLGRLLHSARFGFHHGLLIIEDEMTLSGHDDWDPADQGVHATSDSIYLSVQPDVDGEVDVAVYLSDVLGATPPGLSDSFTGILQVASGKIVISDPDGTFQISVQVTPGAVPVKVLTDDISSPAVVDIVVGINGPQNEPR